MRRIARLDRSIDILRPRVSTPYLCSACKHQSPSFSTSTLRAARDRVPISEKVRRKIWGTDNPPGQENPYGDASLLDRTRQREERLDAEEAEEAAAAKRKAEERRTAAPATSIPDSSYEPAETWDDLEHVGGYAQYWKEVWDPEHQFVGFMPKPEKVLKDNEAILAAVHRAVVETLILKEAKIPYERLFGGDLDRYVTRRVQVVLATDGSSALEYPKRRSRDSIIEVLTLAPGVAVESQDIAENEEFEEDSEVLEETSTKENPTGAEEDVAADRSSEDPLGKPLSQHPKSLKLSAKDISADIASWNPAWLQVSLKDPALKFAILKRTLQLTGIQFPDAALNHTNDVQSLLPHLFKAPKPRKLDQALRAKKELTQLPNVHVKGRRISSIDKEKAVGRWKVIQQELTERDLPITGHAR